MKGADRPYRAGRSPDWVKVKNRKRPAVAPGELAADISRLVEIYVRAVEASDLEKRLKAVEEAMKCGPGR